MKITNMFDRKKGRRSKRRSKYGFFTKGALLFKRCPECNSRKIATSAETGEKFCKKCGLVLL